VRAAASPQAAGDTTCDAAARIALAVHAATSPVNAVSVSYVLGAAGVRFPPFVLATVRWLDTGVFARLSHGEKSQALDTQDR